MITINANTKIAALLKAHPDALEAIISISPKFNKLRNPILRKIMASRATIYMAAKVGACSVNDFFEKLKPLGFKIDTAIQQHEVIQKNEPPKFMKILDTLEMQTLDVRPVIEQGKDPFQLIMSKVKELKRGSVLKLINTFEPLPLIAVLAKQGFDSYIAYENNELVNTYFYKEDADQVNMPTIEEASDWDEIYKRFENDLLTVDVRQLEMPQPMHTILEALENLQQNKALYVYHKRVPLFLLPELNERKFQYRIKEISDSEVHMIIYR